MSRISGAFKNGKALITFIMAGDPSLSFTEKLVLELEKSGADIVEIGIPFSDSIADGPVIVEAASRAIKRGIGNGERGMGAAGSISLVKRLRKKTSLPIIFMTSCNIVFSYGVKKFMAEASNAGADGLILPDLPPEEAGEVRTEAGKRGLDMIFLVAPNTPESRVKMAVKASSGFIYLVSTTGTTGVRAKLSDSIKGSVRKIRKYSDKPIAVGFGISTPAHAKEASGYADGVIVGSALIKNLKNAGRFVSSLKKAICTY